MPALHGSGRHGRPLKLRRAASELCLWLACGLAGCGLGGLLGLDTMAQGQTPATPSPAPPPPVSPRAAPFPASSFPGLQLNTNATFSSATEALAMLFQVVGNLKEKVDTGDLESIHSEDMVLTASIAALLHQANPFEATRRETFRAEFVQLGQHVAALHLAGDTRREAAAVQEMRQVQDSFERIKTYFGEATVRAARQAASVYLCPSHRDVRGTRRDTCPKCGGRLDQLARILPAFCGLPTPSTNPVRAALRTADASPLSTGRTVKVFLQLSRADGTAVYPSDLIVSHTERVHLLIIDASLTDYHHEHPRPTRGAGEYGFSFTPNKPGPYRVWADVRAQPMGLQEYAIAMLPSPSPGEPIDRTETNQVVVEGLRFQLSFAEEKLRAGRPVLGRLQITRTDGTPFTQLEPFMDVFAHLVGFYEDGQTVLHLHPQGPLVTSPNARGGPDLEFQLYALKPGFVRLFAQVQVNGVSQFAPFGLRIVW